MRGFFITGTDTGVGKTIVAGLSARYAAEQGYGVVTQKWIQTGSKGFPKDVDAHLRLMGRQRAEIKNHLARVCSYNLRYPSSPHLAAGLEKTSIDGSKIKRDYRFLSKRYDVIIAEGIGGVLVPYGGKRLVIDIAVDLKMRILIVAGNRLGAINHTILTVEALKGRKAEIAGIVFNDASGKEDKKILKDNPAIVGRLTGVPILGVLPYTGDRSRLHKSFKSVGRKIF